MEKKRDKKRDRNHLTLTIKKFLSAKARPCSPRHAGDDATMRACVAATRRDRGKFETRAKKESAPRRLGPINELFRPERQSPKGNENRPLYFTRTYINHHPSKRKNPRFTFYSYLPRLSAILISAKWILTRMIKIALSAVSIFPD